MTRHSIIQLIITGLIISFIAVFYTSPVMASSTELEPKAISTVVDIQATYEDMDPQTLEKKVLHVIREAVTNIEDLEHISSSSDPKGNIMVTLQFKASYEDPDQAIVMTVVQVENIRKNLPKAKPRKDINISNANYPLIGIVSIPTNNKMSQEDLIDTVLRKKDPLNRVIDVADVVVFDRQLSLQIILDTSKMSQHNLIIADILSALRLQTPILTTQSIETTPTLNVFITTDTPLTTADEFADIVLKVNNDNTLVRIKDIATIQSHVPENAPISNINYKSSLAISENKNDVLLGVAIFRYPLSKKESEQKTAEDINYILSPLSQNSIDIKPLKNLADTAQ